MAPEKIKIPELQSKCAHDIHGICPLNKGDMLKLIRDDIPFGIVLFDAADAVWLVNRAMQRILGEPCSRLLGRAMSVDSGEFPLTCFLDKYLEAKKAMTPVNFHNVSLVNDGGEKVYLTGGLSPLRRDNAFHGMILTAEQINDAVLPERNIKSTAKMHPQTPLALMRAALETVGVPEFTDYGEFRGFHSIDNDIAERKTARHELQKARDELGIKVKEWTSDLLESTRNLQSVLRGLSDGILTVDADLKIINANEALQCVCARADQMRPGVHMDDLFEDGEYPPCLKLARDVRRTREPIRGYHAKCRFGQKGNQVVMVNASPLYDLENHFAGAMIVVRDATQRDAPGKRPDERCIYRNIVGRNPNMLKIYQILGKLTDMKTTVLITGESGTGKELIVEALHYGSSTITGPLIKVNCSALAESLLESELFGHVRGAFTGAVNDKIGRFQAAEGGTIFLDEIGDMSLNIQLKLLRVLERKEYERVGDSTTYKADIRVVAATNNDLLEKVRQGVFREDLYYRLRVMVINILPLRERVDDIPLLCEHFMNQFRESYSKDIREIAPDVMDILTGYLWPGNVRELKHTVEHAFIVCEEDVIGVSHLPTELRRFARLDERAGLEAEPRHAERLRLLSALERSHWNKTKAARLLGVSRNTLYRKMEALVIRP